MEINALREIMQNRWSARVFDGRQVPKDRIVDLLESARYAASGCNSQPWEFIILSDPELKEKIIKILVDSIIESAREDLNFPYAPGDVIRKRFEAAPVTILACADTRFKRSFPAVKEPERILYMSLGGAFQNMSLTATATGLSLGFYSLGKFETGPLKKELRLPDFMEPCELLQLGYPETGNPGGYKRPALDYIHTDALDRSKLRSDEHIDELIASRKFPDIYSGRLE